MKSDQLIYSVILAGGSGSRMGGVLKQFLRVNKYPIIFYSLDIFLKCSFISGIIIVVPHDKVVYMRKIISKKYPNKKIDVISGGKTRRSSSFSAINFISKEKGGCDYVIFHDGVRPLITKKMVQSVIMEAKTYGAAVLGSQALNVVVTLKDKKVLHAINANTVYNTQTPHCYKFDLIKRAHESKINKKAGSDTLENIELVKSLGVEIKLVDKFYRNMKLTFPQDIVPLSSLLKCARSKTFFDLSNK
jgi:2-C-methyl-D-erythritol 4-phosphate cytidylyltransferase